MRDDDDVAIEKRLYLYFQYLLGSFVVSAITSALGTEIDLDVIETSCANANRLDSLECHNCFAAGTIDILFRVLIHPYSLDRRPASSLHKTRIYDMHPLHVISRSL